MGAEFADADSGLFGVRWGITAVFPHPTLLFHPLIQRVAAAGAGDVVGEDGGRSFLTKVQS